MQQNISIPIAIVIAGLLIGGAIIYSNNSEREYSSNPGEESLSDTSDTIDPGDHIQGNPEALITIVEFSDFECSFCANFSQTMDQIVKEYQNDVKWAYRHFPLGFHNNAQPAAEASECAAEQNMFWAFHDGLFENQADLGLDLYLKLAQDLNLDVDQLEDCISSRKYKDKVEDDYQVGIQNGVEGTPGNFINGVPLGGAVSYSQLKDRIDLLLEGGNN